MRVFLCLLGLVGSAAVAQETPTAGSRAAAITKPVFSTVDAVAIKQLLIEAGDEVTLTLDPTGTPMLEASHHGAKYRVLFYKCDKGKQCKMMQFRIKYELDKAPRSTVLNTFNRDMLYGRVFKTEAGAIAFEENVWTTGGVTWDHLRARRNWFYEGVRVFERHLANQ